jgi:16S rRNA processing protein RimM
VGQVLGAHGLNGELKVRLLTDDPHRFGRLSRVHIGPDGAEPVPWELDGYRLHKGRALLQLAECRDRDAAQAMRGQIVQVPVEDAIPLEDGEYFEHQIVGLDVWTLAGENLGTVAEIIYTGSNEVYVVRRPGPVQQDLLIPAIEDVVLKVDPEAGRLIVELPSGLDSAID